MPLLEPLRDVNAAGRVRRCGLLGQLFGPKSPDPVSEQCVCQTMKKKLIALALTLASAPSFALADQHRDNVWNYHKCLDTVDDYWSAHRLDARPPTQAEMNERARRCADFLID